MPTPPPAPAPDPTSLVGTVLDGRYELVAHLASGGMGAVFQARHIHLRKDVAVKVLRPELAASPDLVERFRREAEIASALEHDNIVRVTDFGRSEEGLLFLAMELLTGESLFDRLRRERALPPVRAVGLLFQVCAGLQAAHGLGVVHRDLKPENVFLARTPGGREVVKLLDFGIAKFARGPGDTATQVGVVVGTPEYLSPEQAMGLPVDCRADVYTVGLIAFRMLTGRHPFPAESPRDLLLKQASCPVQPLAEASPDLAAWPALCAAVELACRKDPAERPPSAAALGELLAASLGPAFVAPPGATPALGPASAPVRRPPPQVDPTLSLSLPVAPAALPYRRALRLTLWTTGIAALVALSLLGFRAWRARPLQEARELIGSGRAAEAVSSLQAALQADPGRRDLELLRARALLGLPGKAGEALEAYAAAQASGPLELDDYRALVPLLGEERSLADRAARLLRAAPPAAVPAVAEAAGAGSGVQRLRAVTMLRDMGAEDAVDRVAAYGALLADADCDVRRAAARRLGELGDPAALPALRAAAGARAERRWLISSAAKGPACGAAEAGEAVRRIQSANP
ncbi:MAG TPA: protein kinase [Anaeromyxobacter sp.]|nr:protein kinase [Anaeromyxobacter sp.]